jgi:L-methionine (R)-S-oxide reductase
VYYKNICKATTIFLLLKGNFVYPLLIIVSIFLIMAHNTTTVSGTKSEQYQYILSQAEALIAAEVDSIANLANITALLKFQFHWLWIGFYRVLADELVLGPFQGPLACTRIAKGKGVCGTTWEKAETIIVPDVHQFPGHIACSSLSCSEIVVPIIKGGKVIGVLDIDSEAYHTFDIEDKQYLEILASQIATLEF